MASSAWFAATASADIFLFYRLYLVRSLLSPRNLFLLFCLIHVASCFAAVVRMIHKVGMLFSCEIGLVEYGVA